MDPIRMAALKVSAADIIDAIDAENYQSAAGQTRSSLVQTNVNAITDTADPEIFKRFIIRDEGANAVRLGDVADVALGAEKLRQPGHVRWRAIDIYRHSGHFGWQPTDDHQAGDDRTR